LGAKTGLDPIDPFFGDAKCRRCVRFHGACKAGEIDSFGGFVWRRADARPDSEFRLCDDCREAHNQRRRA
jgi:hypothetical protein